MEAAPRRSSVAAHLKLHPRQAAGHPTLHMRRALGKRPP
eukprot:CAMPEP_0185907652 /NCGR_PEP_ID=MMETSP0196C-20130402/7467_1 /TAXON_ID=2932 /ORGANISM="Alexandrium fundyense, Strain CCMP1719" /LENGTH=38 /DNA_ID= /DNA_START= /DNA_END= /DNA_ORIENTATION=